jgi:colanic acid/amylovoran biosynthesis glycosyltransferase
VIRVLAFCDYYEPPMGGGAEIVSAEVYERLAGAGQFDITVVSGVPGRSRSSAADTEGAVKVQRRWALDLSRLIGGQFSLSPGVLWSTIRQMRTHRPDVVHASSIHFVGSFVGALAAWMWRVPLVTTCHLSGLDALPPRTRFLASFYERLVGRFILGRSSAVIAVSGAVRDHVVSSGTDPQHVVVVENGVDTDRFQPGERGAATSTDAPVRIAFVGRLIANKAPLELIEAVSELETACWQLDVAGDGPLHGEIEAAALRDHRIHALGHRTDVEAVLAEADIFVRTSTTEGRSLAILEAMAAGCAVVASDIPANSEMISDGHNGLLVRAGDVAALSKALQSLLVDPHLRQRLGEAARADALAVSWDSTAEATGAVLAQAAASSR